EGANLATFHERGDQVDDFDAGFKDLNLGGLFFEAWGRTVNGPPGGVFDVWLVIYGLAEDVKDAAQCFGADGHADGAAGVDGNRAALHAIGGSHGDAAHPVVAQVLLYFQRQRLLDAFDGGFNGIIDRWKFVGWKLDVHHRAQDLHNRAFGWG